MTLNGYLQIGFYLVVLVALAKPLGLYMARVYEGKSFGLDRALGPVERLIYRLCGVRPDEEMGWKTYALAMLLLNAAGLLFLYNAAASSGSNLGPTNEALMKAVEARAQALRQADPQNTQPIPVDLVTASGSGLDPHISPAAVFYQGPRVARVRNLNETTVRELVEKNIEGRQWGFLDEPRHNEFNINLAFVEARLAGERVRGRLALQTGTSVNLNYAAEVNNRELAQLLQEKRQMIPEIQIGMT